MTLNFGNDFYRELRNVPQSNRSCIILPFYSPFNTYDTSAYREEDLRIDAPHLVTKATVELMTAEIATLVRRPVLPPPRPPPLNTPEAQRARQVQFQAFGFLFLIGLLTIAMIAIFGRFSTTWIVILTIYFSLLCIFFYVAACLKGQPCCKKNPQNNVSIAEIQRIVSRYNTSTFERNSMKAQLSPQGSYISLLLNWRINPPVAQPMAANQSALMRAIAQVPPPAPRPPASPPRVVVPPPVVTPPRPVVAPNPPARIAVTAVPQPPENFYPIPPVPAPASRSPVYLERLVGRRRNSENAPLSDPTNQRYAPVAVNNDPPADPSNRFIERLIGRPSVVQPRIVALEHPIPANNPREGTSISLPPPPPPAGSRPNVVQQNQPRELNPFDLFEEPHVPDERVLTQRRPDQPANDNGRNNFDYPSMSVVNPQPPVPLPNSEPVQPLEPGEIFIPQTKSPVPYKPPAFVSTFNGPMIPPPPPAAIVSLPKLHQKSSSIRPPPLEELQLEHSPVDRQ